MTHFLRNSKNETIVDIEATKDDIHCCIDIVNYSLQLLLMINREEQVNFIRDIDMLSEIRGIWFETSPDDKDPDALVERLCKDIGEKWSLFYITD